MVIGGLAPMIIGAVLKAQVSSTMGIIGGADGPTSIIVSGVIGTGNVVLEIAVGVLLIVAGILGLAKCKK